MYLFYTSLIYFRFILILKFGTYLLLIFIIFFDYFIKLYTLILIKFILLQLSDLSIMVLSCTMY